MFALVPALQASRATLTAALGAHGGGGQRGSRLRATLVAGQVAISLLLVVPALTLARNGVSLRSADVGFDLTDVMSINVREGDEVQLVQRLRDGAGAEPRVGHFAVSNGNPLFGPPERNRGGAGHADADALHVRLARVLRRRCAFRSCAAAGFRVDEGSDGGARRDRQPGDRARSLARSGSDRQDARVAASSQSGEGARRRTGTSRSSACRAMSSAA